MSNNNTWQPIETAPRDGARILAFDPHWYDIPFVGYWLNGLPRVVRGKSQNGSWYMVAPGSNSYEMYPTHWMPLPEPPSEDTQGA